MNKKRTNHDVTLANLAGNVYVFGGEYGSSVEKFDSRTNSWSIVPCLTPLEERKYFAAAMLDI